MSNQDNKKKVLSRRDFLKTIGAAGVATTGLSACVGGGKDGTSTAAAGEIPTDRMTYRTNPTSGDKVSLLGFGMMRLPSVGGRSAREGNEEIDQEMVNELVDYAIAHGVNYFDTSPAYCRGRSEHATGIALNRHPRDKYFIATKLSNFSPATWSWEVPLVFIVPGEQIIEYPDISVIRKTEIADTSRLALLQQKVEDTVVHVAVFKLLHAATHPYAVQKQIVYIIHLQLFQRIAVHGDGGLAAPRGR